MIKFLYTIPLHPTLFPLFPQGLTHNPLTWKSPTYHIHWEIAIFIPPPPPPKNPRKIQKLQWTMKLLSTNPMHPSLHPLPPTMLTPDSLARQYPTTHIHLETVISISKSPPTPTPPGKKTWKSMIKLLYTTPCPLILSHYPPKGFWSMDCLDSLQPPIFIEKLKFSCNLHHRQKTLEKSKNYN